MESSRIPDIFSFFPTVPHAYFMFADQDQGAEIFTKTVKVKNWKHFLNFQFFSGEPLPDNKPLVLRKLGIKWVYCCQAQVILFTDELKQMCSFFQEKLEVFSTEVFAVIETKFKLFNGKPVPLFLYIYQNFEVPSDCFYRSVTECILVRSIYQINNSWLSRLPYPVWKSEFVEFRKKIQAVYFSV